MLRIRNVKNTFTKNIFPAEKKSENKNNRNSMSKRSSFVEIPFNKHFVFYFAFIQRSRLCDSLKCELHIKSFSCLGPEKTSIISPSIRTRTQKKVGKKNVMERRESIQPKGNIFALNF